MIVSVDLDLPTAPWRQVRDQILALVARGALPVGARLPPIRQLARDLGVSPGTVARAYRELEAVGVLRTGRRNGTEVARAEVPDPLAELAGEYLRSAAALGASPAAALDAVARAAG